MLAYDKLQGLYFLCGLQHFPGDITGSFVYCFRLLDSSSHGSRTNSTVKPDTQMTPVSTRTHTLAAVCVLILLPFTHVSCGSPGS